MNTRTAPRPSTVHRLAALVAGAAISAGLVVGATGVAGAAPTTATGDRFEAAKTACTDAVDRRISAVNTVVAHVDGAADLTASHKASLDSQLGTDVSRLTALGAQLRAATQPAALLDACRTVVPDYRIYVLEIPKAHLTIAADRVAAVSARLTNEVAPKLQDAITRADARDVDTSAAQAALDDLLAKSASAQGAASPVGDQLLGLTPAQFNDGSAAPIEQQAHTALQGARNDLAAAVADAHTVVSTPKAGR